MVSCPPPASAAVRWPRCCLTSVHSAGRCTRRCVTRSPRSSSTAGSRPRPGSRPSASSPASLGLSRATVTAAYDALRSSRYLTSRTGSGSYVTVPAGTEPRASVGVFRNDAAAEDVIDLSCAALPAVPGVLQAGRDRCRCGTAPLRRGRGLRACRAPRTARAGRAAVQRAGRSDVRRPDPDHQRRVARARPAAAVARRAGRPAADGAADLPGRDRRRSRGSACAPSPSRWPRPAVGTSRRCGRRCARPHRGSPS